MLVHWEPKTIPTYTYNNTCADECKAADESHADGDTGIPDILVSQLMVRAAMSTKTAYTSTPAEPMTELLQVIQNRDKDTAHILSELASKDCIMLSNLP